MEVLIGYHLGENTHPFRRDTYKTGLFEIKHGHAYITYDTGVTYFLNNILTVAIWGRRGINSQLKLTFLGHQEDIYLFAKSPLSHKHFYIINWQKTKLLYEQIKLFAQVEL